MRVILFFTYGISLLEWKKSGLLDREIKLYEKLNKDYGLNFTFVTYGDKSDFAIIVSFVAAITNLKVEDLTHGHEIYPINPKNSTL